MKPILLSIQFLSWCSNCHLPKWMCELSHRESKIPCVQLLTRLAFLSYFQDIKNEGGSSTPSSLCIAYVPNQPLTNHTVHTQPHNTSCTIIERNPHYNKSKFSKKALRNAVVLVSFLHSSFLTILAFMFSTLLVTHLELLMWLLNQILYNDVHSFPPLVLMPVLHLPFTHFPLLWS